MQHGRARLRWSDAAAQETGAQIFQCVDNRPNVVSFRAFVRATLFQLRVWRALVRVPAGAVISYGLLASGVGHPSAARAVGTAVGSNSFAFLIPCHRVIRETEVIGQYRWQHDRKRAILGWEAARRKQMLDSASVAS
jgi:AraC family transcriptional regulator, regulatory protein of adaptative response / methylated-DNA-[protein]-cysteine methyltransferase